MVEVANMRGTGYDQIPVFCGYCTINGRAGCNVMKECETKVKTEGKFGDFGNHAKYNQFIGYTDSYYYSLNKDEDSFKYHPVNYDLMESNIPDLAQYVGELKSMRYEDLVASYRADIETGFE